MAEGDRLITGACAGGLALTAKLTAIVCDTAPGAVSVMVAECVATPSPDGFALTEKLPLFVPDADDPPFNLSHDWFDTAVHVSVPVPALLTFTV